MKVWMLMAAVAALAACSPKPAAPANATAAPTNVAQPADSNATCTAAALQPGTQACNDYLAAMAQANAAGGAVVDANANATQMRAQIQAQMDQQRAQMQQQMQSGQSNAACTTTRDANNNVSTVCP